jgi:methyl-accepting chemotaxis protein
MDQTQDPGHPATGELAPEVSGRGLGLRSRLLGAILVVALTTVGVGLFGIQRMSVLSDQAQTVYDEGTLPVNAMRELQVDWWTLSANVARAAIPTLPPDTIAKAQRGTLDMTAALAEDIAATSEMPLDPQAKAAFETFATATQTYLTALAQLQQVSVTTPTVAAMGPLLKTMAENEAIIEASLIEATEATSAAPWSPRRTRRTPTSPPGRSR